MDDEKKEPEAEDAEGEPKFVVEDLAPTEGESENIAGGGCTNPFSCNPCVPGGLKKDKI
jgi:hypothetical protein